MNFSCGFEAHQAQKTNDNSNNSGYDHLFDDDEDNDMTIINKKKPELQLFSSDDEDSNDSADVSSSDYEGDDENCSNNNNDIGNDEKDKCAICLEPEIGYANRAYTSGCFHKFCFDCLHEWSKVSLLTCPLCKRKFDRIVYDCHSMTDFKELYVTAKPQQAAAMMTPPSSPGSSDSGYNTTPLIMSTETSWNNNKASWIVGKQCAPVLFRALVYANEWYVDPTMSLTDSRERTGVVQYTSQRIMHQDRFRAALSSSQWYREHEHELMAWLARELCALAYVSNNSALGGHHMLLQMDKVLLMELLDKLVKMLLLQLLDKLVFDENDLAVVDSVAELMHLPKQVARHFVHELAFFVAAPSHDMVEFDAHAVYFERAKAMRPRFFLTSTMLPVNLSKFRLVPPPDVEGDLPEHFGAGMAKEYVAAGVDKDDYVKRILMLDVNDDDDDDDEQQPTMRSNPSKRRRRNAESDESVASSCSSLSDESDETQCMLLSTSSSSSFDQDMPEPPPPSPQRQQSMDVDEQPNYCNKRFIIASDKKKKLD